MKKITVGVSEIKPLVYKENAVYTGFEVELWEKIAQKADIEFEYKEYQFKNLLNAVKNKKIDIGFSGITRTQNRETIFDFSHYTLNSGLSILISGENKISLFKYFKGLPFEMTLA